MRAYVYIMYVCMYVCMYVFLVCVSCVFLLCGQSVGNPAKEAVCIYATSQAGRFIRVGLIALRLLCVLCACVRPATLNLFHATS